MEGINPKKIVRPQACRLNCRIPRAVQQYNTRLEQKIWKHRLIERIGQVYQAQLAGEEAKHCLDKIDEESRNYMINAEQKCRKMQSGQIPFSPEAAKWIRWVQVLKSLMKYAHSRKGNHGNLRQAAYRGGYCCSFSDLGRRSHSQD